MKLLLLCNACGHSESLNSAWGINECPKCKSAKIELIPYSKTRGSKSSSDGFLKENVGVIFGIIGVILLISGVGTIVNNFPLGITLIIIGVIILVIFLGIITHGKCLLCFQCFEFCS